MLSGVLFKNMAGGYACGGAHGVILLFMLIASSSAGETAFWFSPAGCEFKVKFSEEPIISKQYIEDVGYASTAVGGKQGDAESTVVLIAEGMPIDEAFLRDVDHEAFLLERAQQYATFNGLEHVEFMSETTNLGNIISFRGGKVVGGTRVLYMGKIVLGKRSALMLRGGGAAASFPQEGLLGFIESVKLQGAKDGR